MVWVIIERCVHLVTLVLLVLMICIIFNNNKAGDERNNFNLQLEQFKAENQKVRTSNISYLENRINRVAETQDGYQVTTGSKLSLLENRLDRLAEQYKISPKIINTNNNNSNAVVNVPFGKE